MKKSFVLYNDNYDGIKDFTVEEKAELLDLVFEYNRNPKILSKLEITPRVLGAFGFLKSQFDRDTKKWMETREKRKRAGRIGGLTRAKNENLNVALASNTKQVKQDLANQAVSVSVSVNKEKNIKKRKDSPFVDNSGKKSGRDFTPDERKFIFDELSKQSLKERGKYGK